MRERAQRFDPRQVMHSGDFEIFHYKEPKPDGVEVHHHTFFEVYFLLGGEVDYWVDGRIVHLQPGDLLLINPMELHRPLLKGGDKVYERIVLWINTDYLERFSGDGVDLTQCFNAALPSHKNLLRPTVTERSSLTALLGELVREYYSPALGNRLSAAGIFLQFMVALNRMALRADTQKVRAEEKESSTLVAQVLRYIGEHCSEELSLETIAARFFVSKYHLAHAFRREVGVSVYRYVVLKRLLMARQLLAAGHAAGEVCFTCGFSDYTAFYRAFKGEYGISPREFMAEEAGEE